MTRRIICIACPRGCSLRISGSGEELEIDGNQCRKGLDYGRQEVLQPRRMLTTTVKTANPDFPRLPVRLSREVSKEKLFEYMRVINCFTAERDCSPGDVLMTGILEEDVNLVAAGELSYGE